MRRKILKALLSKNTFNLYERKTHEMHRATQALWMPFRGYGDPFGQMQWVKYQYDKMKDRMEDELKTIYEECDSDDNVVMEKVKERLNVGGVNDETMLKIIRNIFDDVD